MILIFTNLYLVFIFCICYNAKLFSSHAHDEKVNNDQQFDIFFICSIFTLYKDLYEMEHVRYHNAIESNVSTSQAG